MSDTTTTINNVAYSWSMITLQSLDLTGAATDNPTILSGVQAIKWNKKRNVATNYGLGGKPVNRGFGNYEYTASITMDYNTQVQLRGTLDSLEDLGEFDLTISWANEGDLTAETVTLKKCFFSEEGLEVSQDDTQITMEFDLNPFDIVVTHATV